jgi:hypothetical protein
MLVVGLGTLFVLSELSENDSAKVIGWLELLNERLDIRSDNKASRLWLRRGDARLKIRF